jgi:replicative DNA helicase
MAEVNPIQIAELRLLRNLWANPNLLDSQEYSDDLFCSVFCKTISKAIDTLTKNGTPLTTDALYMESARNDSSITRDLVKSITESTAESGEYITDIVKVLKDYKRTTSALDHLDHIKDVLSKNNVLTPEITQELRENFDAAEEQVLRNDEDSVKRIMDLKEWGDQWQEDFKLRTNGKRYYFSEPVLDELVVDGPAPGTGGLLVAQSGMGKSTMVLKLVNGFINAGIPCMFFSLEMGSIATYDRLLANRLQIPYTEIVNPPDAETYQAIYDQVQQERQFLDKNKLFRFCEDANVSISELKKAIIKFQQQIGQKYCIVVLDLITMIQDFVTTKSGLGMPQTIELAINKMNALSKELGIHYIGTAQLNRAGESTAVTDPEDVLRFRPSRHQVKNSSALL